MSTFTVKFDTDNSAFECDRDYEIALVLRRIADRIEANGMPTFHSQTVRDTNGNDIGRYALKDNE